MTGTIPGGTEVAARMEWKGCVGGFVTGGGSASAVIRHRLPVQLQCAGYLSLSRLGEASVSFSIVRTITFDPLQSFEAQTIYRQITDMKQSPRGEVAGHPLAQRQSSYLDEQHVLKYSLYTVRAN